MRAISILFTALGLSIAAAGENSGGGSFLAKTSYVLDEEIRAPVERYNPQAGDIFLCTDRSRIIEAGHKMALSGAPHHSGIVVNGPDGKPAILESGPFNGLSVEIVDFFYDAGEHERRGEKVWIRHRATPLSAEQDKQLTDWAVAQNGKRFAAGRMLMQLTPIRNRGPLRTYVLGAPKGEHSSYFCSELVLETCVHVGLLSAETTRPSATYPRDLFFDSSPNKYLNENFTLAPDWNPPARWISRTE